MTCLPTPLVPRVSSSRSQCYHKLPDHAVKLMQEWLINKILISLEFLFFYFYLGIMLI